MKSRLRYILLLLVVPLLPRLEVQAQEFYNDGAEVYVQAGGLIYVQGNVTNDDQGTNIGQMFNSGDIMLEGDWSNTGSTNVFQAGDPGTTTFLGNNALQMIQGSNPTNFNNLTLDKPGGTREVRQSLNSLCDGVLALNDDFLNTQTNLFAVTSVVQGAITRAGGNTPNYMHSVTQGYVTSTVGSTGRLARATLPDSTYLFPVGTAARWRPVEITPTTGTTNAYSVQFVDQATPNTNLRATTLATVNPAWYHFIERQLPIGSPETIRIYHDFVADDICDIGNVTISEWNTSLWDDLSPVNSANPTPFMSWTEKAGYPGTYPTPFNTNQFALAGRFLAPNISSCVFPVELLYLTANAQENSILLNWETATETNNSGFEVQRSLDGIEFSDLGWVNGAGNSQVNQAYDFEDFDVLPNQRYFYRLRQLDFNGGETYSNIVEAVLLKGIDYAIGGFFPNPTRGQTSLWVSLAEPTRLQIQIVNALGQEVLRIEEKVNSGFHTFDLNVDRLAAGVYLAKVQLNNEKIMKRLVVED
ncbi:MAG: T9SS type A sorting domain-containing protein [Bacteroidota bacterium]